MNSFCGRITDIFFKKYLNEPKMMVTETNLKALMSHLAYVFRKEKYYNLPECGVCVTLGGSSGVGVSGISRGSCCDTTSASGFYKKILLTKSI